MFFAPNEWLKNNFDILAEGLFFSVAWDINLLFILFYTGQGGLVFQARRANTSLVL